MLAGQTQSSGQKKGDAANASLNDFSNGMSSSFTSVPDGVVG